jgi:nucleoside-diphosphate-sugar epimerase
MASHFYIPGCGFIGRHLVTYLVENELAALIRIVDKTMPCLAYLNERQKRSFECVEFVSANLLNGSSCQNAYKQDDGGVWDLVFNCAGETKLAQAQEVYEEGIYKLSVNCAEAAVANRSGRFVELSTGCVCSNESTPQIESCPIEPWNMAGKFKAAIEEKLKTIEGLNHTILRLPMVYGIGDRRGLTPRIIIASLYKDLKTNMKLLWTPSMKINTVHVSDVVAAMWQLGNDPAAAGEIVNIVDDSQSTQGSITDVLCEIFKITADYWGVTLSNLAKWDYTGAVEEINEAHLAPWAKICAVNSILNTPLSPYLDKEFLYYKHLNLSNEKLKSVFGYSLLVPILTRQRIEEIINDFIEQKLFPAALKM